MGRELRRVPPTWNHPIDWTSNRRSFKPLHEGPWETAAAAWDARKAAFERGEDEDGQPLSDAAKASSFEDWDGSRPRQEDYMPTWTDAEQTHFQMYETCSEGTPISPVLPTPQEVAQWCADNGASAFGSETAPYDYWIRVCEGSAGFGIMLTVPSGAIQLV